MELIPGITTIPGAEHPDRKRGRRVRITPQHIATAENMIIHKMKPGPAMIKAGYAKTTARNPGNAIENSPALTAAILETLKRYEFTAQERTNIVRRRIMKAVLEAKDGDALRACELAGKDKEVRLYQPDALIGVFNMQSPAGITHLIEDTVDSTATPNLAYEPLSDAQPVVDAPTEDHKE